MTIGIFGSKYEYENAIKWKICGEGRKGVVLHICERHEVVNVTEEIIPFEWMEKVLWKIYPFPRDTLGSPPSSYIGLPRGHQRRINAATVSLSHRNPFTFFSPAIRLLFPSPILIENDSSLSLSFSLIELFRSLGEKLLKVTSEIIRLFIGIYVLGVSFLGSLRDQTGNINKWKVAGIQGLAFHAGFRKILRIQFLEKLEMENRSFRSYPRRFIQKYDSAILRVTI